MRITFEKICIVFKHLFPRQKNNNNNKKRKYENIPFKSITELEEEKYKYFKSFVFLPSGNIEEEQRGTLIKA